jgi:predicted DNA-binding transcriptional regulator YafY
MPNKGSAWEQLVRLHNLVRFLTERSDRGATFEEIQETVYGDLDNSSAFRKKFYRDRKALEEIYNLNENMCLSEGVGENEETDESYVKIYKQKGRYYIKSEHTFMLPMTILEEELQALVAGVKLAGHFIKPLEPYSKSLWNRFKKQFSSSKMERGERLSRSISIAAPVSNVNANPKIFQDVVQAIDDKKVLKVSQYEERDGKKSSYTISPNALFFKYHAWYLVGISPEKNEASPAVFRLNRMKIVEPLPNGDFIESPYSPEELRENIELDFDPDKPNKEYLIKLRITGSFAKPVMETEWYRGEKKKAALEANGDLSVQYEVKLRGLERITLWIMRALNCVEILEPQELKDEIAQRVDTYLKQNRRTVS